MEAAAAKKCEAVGTYPFNFWVLPPVFIFTKQSKPKISSLIQSQCISHIFPAKKGTLQLKMNFAHSSFSLMTCRVHFSHPWQKRRQFTKKVCRYYVITPQKRREERRRKNCLANNSSGISDLCLFQPPPPRLPEILPANFCFLTTL